jgi:putative chitinase
MTMLSPHFSAEELTRTYTGIPNMPSGDVLARLCETAKQLEKVRALLGGPLLITSGYRSPVVNKIVRGVPTSAHCQGYAADFDPPGALSHYDAARRIEASDIPFDQLILEYGWIHISFDPRMRREVLTKKSATAPYQKGLEI